MKYRFFLSLILCFFSFQVNGEDHNMEGCFRYSFLRLKEDQSIKVTKQEAPLGEYLFIFQPIENAYLYIMIIDSDKSVKLCFPENDKSFIKEYNTFIKEIHFNFTQEQKEPVSLHIIVSTSREKELEQLIKEYFNTKNDETKERALNRIEAKIRWLKRKSEISSNITELPVLGLGVIRDEEKGINLEDLCEIVFKDVYAKTFYFEKQY